MWLKVINVKNFILPLLIIWFSHSSIAQQPSFQLNKIISCEATSLLTDNMGNIYAVGPHEIKKFNAKGDLQFTYSNKEMGEITSVDVSNPLDVLAFYRDFNQLLFLDNMLSRIGEPYALVEPGFDQVSLVCTSRDNGIWLFDQQKYQLIRMDNNFEIIQQSGFINQLIGQEIHPNFMLEYNNQLYMNEPEVGILVFDIFGNYYKTLPFKQIKSFQVAGDRLYYLLGNTIKSYHLKTLEEQEIILPEPNVIRIRIEGNAVFILTSGHISMYTLVY